MYGSNFLKELDLGGGLGLLFLLLVVVLELLREKKNGEGNDLFIEF